jgi:hypothetical protein
MEVLMTNKNDIIKVFTGTEIQVLLLKGELEANGIPAMIRDDFNSALSAGFFSGSPSSLYLFINEADLEKAQPIIDEVNHTDSYEL